MKNPQTGTDTFNKMDAISNLKLTLMQGKFLLKTKNQGFPNQLDSSHLDN